MNKPSILTVHTENEPHILDHIAPLADLLDAPLIVTDEECYLKAKTFYPNQKIELKEDFDFSLKEIAERADCLISCKYWQMQLKSIFQDLYHKKMILAFCPHGQSDKGFQAPLLAPYATQDLVFLYGNLQKKMLEELKIDLKNYLFIGNYRLDHYLKNQLFFDLIAEEKVFSQLQKNRPTILYAPTWSDEDLATSFFEWAKKVIEEVPEEWNLIVKPHPLLEKRSTGAYYRALKELEKRKNFLLLDDFPLIYPLLNRVDAYLGDASSVGYDFLYFNRPLFFITPSHVHKGPLYSCGKDVKEKNSLRSYLEKEIDQELLNKQKMLYQKTYAIFK